MGSGRENTVWILNVLALLFFVLWIPNVQVAHWRCSPLQPGYLYELVILTSWSFFFVIKRQWDLSCLSFSWTTRLRSSKSSLQQQTSRCCEHLPESNTMICKVSGKASVTAKSEGLGSVVVARSCCVMTSSQQCYFRCLWRALDVQMEITHLFPTWGIRAIP